MKKKIIDSKIIFDQKKLRFKNEKSIDYLKIPIEDDNEEPIENFLEQTCNFIGKVIFLLLNLTM